MNKNKDTQEKKKKSDKKGVKVVLILISVLVVIVFMALAVAFLESDEFGGFLTAFYDELDYTGSGNYVVGEYDCKGTSGKTDEFLVTLHLNEDNTFLYGPYGKLATNYAKGTYTYEDENKTNESGEYKYFMLNMQASKENFIVGGVPEGHDFNARAEFGVGRTDGAKKQGVIMFLSTRNTYFCFEK